MLRGDRAGFPATSRDRNNLSRVTQARRIECGAHTQHHIHVVFRKNQRQVTALIETHTVFARNRSTCAYASLHYFTACLSHTFEIVAAAQIKTDQWMEIAIPGM